MTSRALLQLTLAAFLAFAFFANAAEPRPDINLNRQFDLLEQALQLTPAQKVQFDAAIGATKRVMLQVTMASLQAKARIEEELKKPRPDLNVLWELRDAFVEDGKTLRLEARDEWRKLYALLDDDQIKTLKRFMQERIDQLGLLSDFLLDQALKGR
jgi:hypothetical protein